MDDRPLSRAQRFFRRLGGPELFAAMEQESRLWKAECPHCRTDTTSVWDLGGIRYRATGEPRNRVRCPRCGEKHWLRIHWTGGDPAALGPRPSVKPLITKIVLVTMAFILLMIAAVLLLVFKLTGII
jgi:hypothetical protein